MTLLKVGWMRLAHPTVANDWSIEMKKVVTAALTGALVLSAGPSMALAAVTSYGGYYPDGYGVVGGFDPWTGESYAIDNRGNEYYGNEYYGVGYTYSDPYYYNNYGYRYYDSSYYSSSSSSSSSSESKECYRLLNPANGDHIFTTSSSDRDRLIREGWTSEGTAWKARSSSSVPVYELTNNVTGKHFYTKDANEHATLLKGDWRDGGVAFYADTAGTAVYRMCNSIGDHFYTMSTSERDTLVKNGWVNEGTGFYVVG